MGNICVIQTFLFLCFFCTLITSDSSRDLYNNRLEHSQSFGCFVTTNTTVPFQNNLNILFSDFTLKSSSCSFYNTSIGDTPDTVVYGYYMCRGDITHQLCNSCLLNATRFATTSNCEYKDGIYHSEKCIFGYSDHSLYGRLDEQHSVIAFDYVDGNVSNYQQFSQRLLTTITALINEASFEANTSIGGVLVPGFATKEENVTREESIYSMAQCTPDIVGVNCSKCLKDAFSTLQNWANGSAAAVAFSTKCQLRYDNTSFYDLQGFQSNQGVKGLRPNRISVYSVVLFSMHFRYIGLHY